MPWKSRSRRSGGRGNTSRAMSRPYETSGRQGASPSAIPTYFPRISTYFQAPRRGITLALGTRRLPWSGAGEKHRWAGNRARLVVTARGVHGKKSTRGGDAKRRHGRCFFPENLQIGNIPVDAVPLFGFADGVRRAPAVTPQPGGKGLERVILDGLRTDSLEREPSEPGQVAQIRRFLGRLAEGSAVGSWWRPTGEPLEARVRKVVAAQLGVGTEELTP